MAEFIASGRVADLLLAVIALEAAGLILFRRLTGRGPAIIDVVALLLPGACLVVALRAALTGASWAVIALALLASLVTHLFDLARRFGRQGPG